MTALEELVKDAEVRPVRAAVAPASVLPFEVDEEGPFYAAPKRIYP